MLNRSRLARFAAPTLYLVGVLWLSAMAFVSAWPDMEAAMFDVGTSAASDARLRLNCPWVISADEEASIGVTFRNRTDRVEQFLVRTRITSGFVTLVNQDSQQATVRPGGTSEYTWPVSAGDAAYGRLVLARVFATRSATSPARDGSCGVLVAGVTGVNGDFLFLAGVLSGLLFVAAGAAWWWRSHRPLNEHDNATARRVGMLAMLVVASLVTGMLGWWLLSHILLIGSGLFVFMVLERAYSSST